MLNRDTMLDAGGKFITQSLFLELGYSELAVYTLKEVDHIWNNRTYPSLKRLYLEIEDPTEYEFANTHLCGWRHWQRMCENKVIRKHIDEWREELEVKLRSQAIRDAIQEAKKGHFQAAKWVADRGWSTRGAGRPSKADIEQEKRIQSHINNEYGGDVLRLFSNEGK